MSFARSISRHVSGVYVELDAAATPHVREMWCRWFPDIPLVVLPSPYRSIIIPLLDYTDQTDQQAHDGRQTVVVLPEFIPAHWWESLLHNQTSWMLRAALLYKRRSLGFQHVIIDVPYHLKQ